MIKSLLETVIPKEQILCDEPMTKHTSFKVGGKADFFITAKTIEQVKKVVNVIKENKIPYFIIGNGSNLLVKDGGVRGVVLKVDLKEVTIQKKETEILVTAGAGVLLGFLSRKMKQQNIAGLEFACGIPGTIGGAIWMNAGAHGNEMKDIVVSTTVLDETGNLQTLSKEEQNFSYRSSIFQQNRQTIVLETTLKVKEGNAEEIEQKMEEYTNYRKTTQPIEYPSAGSTFKRGTDFITAKLIDECGLKGYGVGGAEVSCKHAGFVINKNKATASDILELIEQIKKHVREKFQKELELEVQIIGEDKK